MNQHLMPYIWAAAFYAFSVTIVVKYGLGIDWSIAALAMAVIPFVARFANRATMRFVLTFHLSGKKYLWGYPIVTTLLIMALLRVFDVGFMHAYEAGFSSLFPIAPLSNAVWFAGSATYAAISAMAISGATNTRHFMEAWHHAKN
ncbi:hypothetical protein [Roseibium aggregatum]|uniref:Uncharacterized protein n=1 Tax=Roseibium aggregatum TaxID=187304 RepID=A0A0M6YAX4_9HYPH|nr:hypothetical protein [Roseibium aggregatum]CTQ47246.1 hypothetical protein LAL4801_05708 [Roseibium aggregatum]